MTQQVRFIPHVKWLWYICEGWTVKPMPCHHGHYSMIASRRVR